MKATKIIAVLAVALVAGTMGLTSCSKGKGGSGKVKGELLPEGNFRVELTEDGSGVIIKGYDDKDWPEKDGYFVKKDVIIPSTIQGLPVKRIDGLGGVGLKYAMTGLVIPEGVEIIGKYAFRERKCLTSVTLPSTLKAIGRDAFRDCGELAVCNLPEGLEYIGQSAFQYTGLTSVSLPKSLKYISEYAFYGCANLAEINIPEGLEVTTTNVEDFTDIFSGDGINKSLALQKLLKETKPKEDLVNAAYVGGKREFDDIIKPLYGLDEEFVEYW